MEEVVKDYLEFLKGDTRTNQERKRVYKVEDLTREECNYLAQKSGRYNNLLRVKNEALVFSTFYYKNGEASGQYFVDNDPKKELVTWYYCYVTKEWM